MPFHYRSGEEIQPGDRVLVNGSPGEVEFVADPDADQTSWYVSEYGGGVIVSEPGVFGQVFFSEPEVEEDLLFVARRDA